MQIQYAPLCVAFCSFSIREKKKTNCTGPPSVAVHPPAPCSCQKRQQRQIQLSVLCWKINKTLKVSRVKAVSCGDGLFVNLLLCACFHHIKEGVGGAGGSTRSSPWLGLCRGVTWGEIG